MFSRPTTQLLTQLSHADRAGANLMRVAIAIVFIWIGLLKLVPYEADSITPMVAQSPLMSFFYVQPAQYKQHMTHEGELDAAKRTWQVKNNTYGFSAGLGIFELLIAASVLANPLSKRLGLLGGLLSFLTPFVTMSFLITTPEAWVPALGDAQHGFPYLSGMGRLIIKDTMMLAGGLVVMADSATALLRQAAAIRR